MLTDRTRSRYRTLLDAAVFATDRPDATVLTLVATNQAPVEVSRARFQARTADLAATLAVQGVVGGDLVAIITEDTLATIFAFWGAIRLGAIPAVFAPLTEKLDANIYRRNMQALIRKSGVRVIAADPGFMARLGNALPCPVIETANAPTDGAYPVAASPSGADPTATALLQHSSGTTGLQKGVALAHAAVLNQLAHYATAIDLRSSDVVINWLPLYHDMGLIAGLLLPLVQGIPVIMMSPFDWVQHPALLLRAITAYRGTLCWLPNFAYNHCARRIRRRDLEGLSLETMRMFINCSEPVYASSHELFIGRFGGIGATRRMLGVSYAMAENTFAVTQTVPNRPVTRDIIDGDRLVRERVAQPVEPADPRAETRVSCGVPIPGTAIKITGDDGDPVPERHIGEIHIRSDCQLSEYYRRPELQPFHDGWYATGDDGYLAAGELYVIGRRKDLIINAGKNIYPQDIEAVINGVPGVHPGRAVAFGVMDEREGTELIGVVAEVNSDDAERRQEINRAIRQAVAQQTTVTVAYLHLVGPRWLIKTSSGKLSRAANRAKWLEERADAR